MSCCHASCPTPAHPQAARRHREVATAAEQSLAAAHQHTAEAKQALAHPLQHPLVRSFRRNP